MDEHYVDPKKSLTIAQKRRLLQRSKAMSTTDLFGNTKTNLLFQSVPETEGDLSENEMPAPEEQGAFPSLPDNVLRLLGLIGKQDRCNKNLNEPDVEEQFARLSLAFKTDRFTLNQRLELQQRQRDIAEKNIESELKSLRESLNALNQLCTDSDMREVITKTQQHVDIVQQTTMRMSSRAETFGAIQQEQRMNCAFETMLNYVEHLKLLYDKEHLELEEYRRLLAENNLLPDEKATIDCSDDGRRLLPPRSHSLSGASKPEGRSRLLSAVCLLNPNSESISGSNSLSSPSLSPKSRRASMPVGPLSGSHHSVAVTHTPLNLRSIPTEILGCAKDSTKSAKDTLSMKEDAGTETPSFPSPARSDDSQTETENDCSLCQGSSSVLRDACRANDKRSSKRRLSYGSSFDEKDELPNFVLSNSLSECDASPLIESEDPVFEECNVICDLRLLRWALSRSLWLCDTNALMLRLRYFLSAGLATAAILCLVYTFLPYAVAAVDPL